MSRPWRPAQARGDHGLFFWLFQSAGDTGQEVDWAEVLSCAVTRWSPLAMALLLAWWLHAFTAALTRWPLLHRASAGPVDGDDGDGLSAMFSI
jgi:hypothetical protein